MILSDCHVHSAFSSDSGTPTEQMVRRAIRSGFHTLCMTEHHDMDFPKAVADRSKMDFQLDLPAYVSEMRRLSEWYQPQIRLLTGVELGMQPHLADRLQSYVRSLPFDHIIGSVHIVDEMDPYYPDYYETYPGKKGVERYLELTLECIDAFSDFDTLGHLDYVVRYCPDPSIYHPADYADLIDAILRRLISRGIALEVNSSALKKGFDQPNPHADILLRYKELGGELLTIGSDAHDPDALGYGFNRIRDLLVSAGFRYYAVFTERKPDFLPLG